MKSGRDSSGGLPRGVKWQWGPPGGGAVQVLLQSSSRCSDSVLGTVWGAVRVAWNAASTASWNHSLVYALTQHFENQWPVIDEEGLLESVSSMELKKVLIRVTLQIILLSWLRVGSPASE